MTSQKKPLNALQAVLDRQAAAVREPAPEPASAPPRPRQAQKPETPARYSRPSRSGTRMIGGHFSPDVAKHLKILAAEEETSVQSLLEEALDLLFVKKGRGHIKRV